jgi:hypothetical protein
MLSPTHTHPPPTPTTPPLYTRAAARLLPELITSWRTLFGVEFTALIVQLAAYGSTDALPTTRNADPLPLLRHDQLSALTLTRGAVALAIDIGDDGYGGYGVDCSQVTNPCPWRLGTMGMV